MLASVNPNITGRVISDFQETKTLQLNENYTESQTISVNLKNITSMTLRGSFVGEEGSQARIYARTKEDTNLLIASIELTEETTTASPFTARVTDQTKQEDNEVEKDEDTAHEESADEEIIEVKDVTEEVEGEEIEDEEVVDDEVVEDELGEELDDEVDEVVDDELDEVVDDELDEVVDEELDDEVDEELDDEDDEVVEEGLLMKEFENLCVQTCNFLKTDLVEIIIEIEQGTLFIEEITYVQEQYYLGEGIKKEVQDINLELNESISLDANQFFEEEDLIFDMKSSEGYSFEVSNNIIEITAKQLGTWDSLLYAVKNETLFISNAFQIIITGEPEEPVEPEEPEEPDEEEPVENETATPEIPVDEPVHNETGMNETIIEENITDTTINETVDCSHPDPNQRPLECIMGENTTFFQEENLVVENKRAERVGRFTPIGNLLIKGEVIENSNQEPNNYDYQFGYTNQETGEFITTIWINTETGDLHLRGRLTEMNNNVKAEVGTYSITNKRGIILGNVDRRQGNMILRGNVIPYRGNLI